MFGGPLNYLAKDNESTHSVEDMESIASGPRNWLQVIINAEPSVEILQMTNPGTENAGWRRSIAWAFWTLHRKSALNG